MKYLLLLFVAPAAICGCKFIGTLFPGHTVATCMLALGFMLLLLCTFTAIILNRSCKPPAFPVHADEFPRDTSLRADENGKTSHIY